MDEIRQLTDEERDASIDLQKFAFQFELTPEERERRKSYQRVQEHWGYFKDGKLASIMRLIPLEIFLQGTTLAMGGIAGVATWPEYRRQGQVGKLLQHSLQVMKDAGQSVSMLHPFSFAFYRRYGWETFIEYKKCTLLPDQLPATERVAGTMRRLDDPLAQWKVLDDIYEPYARQYNGMLKRGPEWWNHLLQSRKSGIAAVYYNEHDQAQGYLLYEVKNRRLDVKEFVALNMEAWHGLWYFIRNHDSMIEQVEIILPIDDPLTSLIDNPRIKQEIIPYFMARVVDMESFLRQFPFSISHDVQMPVQFSLTITDRYADWNNGHYLIEIDAQGNKVVNKRKDSVAEYEGIVCDITTFSSMVFGYRKPSVLHAIGKIRGSAEEIAKWDRLLDWQTPYLADFF